MDIIEYKGIIHFEPEDKTRKHQRQSEWKKMALVMLGGDVAEYYAWFLNKRYNLVLNKPIRGAHVSFISDHIRDIGDNLHKWDLAKDKWDNQEITIKLSLDPRTDSKHWWLNIPEQHRSLLYEIRTEAGLPAKPFFGFHMTIGYANERNIAHSSYIHRILTT